MGFTHYWRLERTITQPEMAQISRDASNVLLAYEGPLAGYDRTGLPEINEDEVSFNGVGDDGCETFCLSTGMDGFNFCKTRQETYDVVVTAMLLIAKDVLKDAIWLTSDGDPADWADGLRLAQRATGRVLSPFADRIDQVLA